MSEKSLAYNIWKLYSIYVQEIEDGIPLCSVFFFFISYFACKFLKIFMIEATEREICEDGGEFKWNSNIIFSKKRMDRAKCFVVVFILRCNVIEKWFVGLQNKRDIAKGWFFDYWTFHEVDKLSNFLGEVPNDELQVVQWPDEYTGGSTSIVASNGSLWARSDRSLLHSFSVLASFVKWTKDVTA